MPVNWTSFSMIFKKNVFFAKNLDFRNITKKSTPPVEHMFQNLFEKYINLLRNSHIAYLCRTPYLPIQMCMYWDLKWYISMCKETTVPLNNQFKKNILYIFFNIIYGSHPVTDFFWSPANIYPAFSSPSPPFKRWMLSGDGCFVKGRLVGLPLR
jgi:hypothetical protein